MNKPDRDSEKPLAGAKSDPIPTPLLDTLHDPKPKKMKEDGDETPSGENFA